MIRQFQISFFIISLLTLAGCAKDEITPTPPSNDPVFSAEGTIDGKEISLLAGEENTYMYTDITNINGVDHYRGALINGQAEIQISISDGMLDVPSFNTDVVASDIQIAPYTDGVLATFSKDDFENSGAIDELTWTIDGVTQTSSDLSINEPGKYDICVDVVFNNGTTGSTCNTFLIGYQKNASAVLKYLVGQNNQIISFVDAPNNEISSIQWYRNDVLVSGEPSYKDSVSGLLSYSLKARISFVNGSYREREIWVNRLSNDYKIEDLSSIENQSSFNWDHKAKIVISIDGEKYITHPGNQDQKITVLNSIDYGMNSDGDEVTLIEGQLNATFIKESTQETVNGSFDIRFGIAH